MRLASPNTRVSPCLLAPSLAVDGAFRVTRRISPKEAIRWRWAITEDQPFLEPRHEAPPDHLDQERASE